MTAAFEIDGPERLREIAAAGLVKDGNIQSLNSLASVWSMDRRRHGGASAWDGHVYAIFYTQNRKRVACIIRTGAEENTFRPAELKYTPALNFCGVSGLEYISIEGRKERFGTLYN